MKIFVNESGIASYRKKNSFFSSHLVCLFVCPGEESWQQRQFGAKRSVFGSCPVFHHPISRWYFSFVALSSYIDRSRRKWSIQDGEKFSPRKSTFQSIFKNSYKSAITMITSHVRCCRLILVKTVSQLFIFLL